MMTKPENCATCGKPTRSHNLAIDVSEHDAVGLPTLAGVVCHTCWTGDTDDVPAVEGILDDHDALVEEVDIELMIAVAAPVEELIG